jgi:hypothetical protein
MTIENRTRDVPACSAVPQPTAPPRAPELLKYSLFMFVSMCSACGPLLFVFVFCAVLVVGHLAVDLAR